MNFINKGVAVKNTLMAVFLGVACFVMAAKKPNIIVIFTDDQGFANYGLNGKDLKPEGEWLVVPGYRLDI